MLKIDPEILENARLYADEHNIPLKVFVEDALEIAMMPEKPLQKQPVIEVMRKVSEKKKTKKGTKKRNRLIAHGGPGGHFDTELLTVVYNIELALIAAGAVADEDYTHLDLFKLAEPYMLDEMAQIKAEGRDLYFWVD